MVRAKQRVAEVRKLRGYFARPEPSAQHAAEREKRSKDMMKVMPCRACNQFGHWSKDKECPKFGQGFINTRSEHGVRCVLSAGADGPGAAMLALERLAGGEDPAFAPRSSRYA